MNDLTWLILGLNETCVYICLHAVKLYLSKIIKQLQRQKTSEKPYN